jgi:hypothetical protein
MVIDARLFVRKKVAGLRLTPEERQRLSRMPEDVQHAIRACQPANSRSRSSSADKPRLHLDLPKHAWGFKTVMDAIARHAGCRPTTLYVWTQDMAQGTLQRQSVWQPKTDQDQPPA